MHLPCTLDSCKSGIYVYTWGGKGVLFREVSSSAIEPIQLKQDAHKRGEGMDRQGEREKERERDY